MTPVWGPDINYTPNYWPEWLKAAGILIVLLLAVMLIHFILRMMNKHSTTDATEEKLYLYNGPVRLWHWTNAILFIGLLATGLLNHFNIGPMPQMVAAHKLMGLMFIAAWLYFIVLNITTGNIKHYVIRWQGFICRCVTQAKFYAFGIIKGEAHPFVPEEGNKFNPLQQPSYIGVVYLLMPIIIVTGLLLFFPSILGKHTSALTVHLVLALVGLIFLLVHLYMCTGGAYLSQIIKGMFDGYSRHEKQK